jgi:hypothetical protein
LLLAGLAALVLAFGLGARFVLRVAQPSSYRVERNALVVFDDAGRVLWRKVFPFPLHEPSYEEDPGRSVWIGDLDRTGRKSVLFVLIPVGEPRQSSPLICFDDHGAEQWRYVPDRRVRTRLAEFVPTYGVSRFLVTALQAGGPNHILAASTHFPYYPSQVALLSTSGSLLREYWHSGHLNHLQAADLNGDGKTEFYAAGISNPRHAATLVALDPDHFGGASAEPETPDYQLLDMGRGIERARVLLPRSCLSAAFDPYNTIALLTILKNEVLVETKEHIVGGGGILHHFSPDLTLHRSVFADSYRIEYQAAKKAGQLPASCKADVIEDARIIALSK